MVEMKALLSLMLALGGAFALLWATMVGAPGTTPDEISLVPCR